MSRRCGILVIANPSAGGLLRVGDDALARGARDAGFEPQIVFAYGTQHLRRILREQVIGKRDRVAIAGGDGTIHHAVQLLAGSGVALGIIPRGHANNFATALKIPAATAEAFAYLAAAKPRGVDLGCAGDEYFTESAGVGLFADMLALSAGRHGFAGALRCANLVMDAFLFGRSRHLVLDIDGVRHEEEVLYVTVANTPLLGYNIPIAPTAKPADAQLDLVVVGPLTRRELVTYWRAVRRREHLELPKVAVRRAREVRIAAGDRWSHVVHVDERACARTPVTIRIAPGALQVLLPVPPETIAS